MPTLNKLLKLEGPASLRALDRAVSSLDVEFLTVQFQAADGTRQFKRAKAVEGALGPKTVKVLTVGVNGDSVPSSYRLELEKFFWTFAGLMAIALQETGVAARSWLGWQVPVHTDDAHGNARIESIGVDEIIQRMENGQVAIVAGFQGISPEGRITTLGRGGTDTSAVALAAALGAERCDIYTDVDGVYTSDPRIVAKARKLDRVTYEEMLEMASVGAKVLQTRSVELAMKHGVRVQVLSAFENSPGTLVVDEDEIVEKAIVSGIAYSRDEAKITLRQVPDRPGVAAAIFGPLAQAHINVDMIVQNVSSERDSTDLTFTVGKAEFDRALKVIEKNCGHLDYEELSGDPNVVKVSVIGVGMRSHAGVAQQMFTALAEKGINIQVISTSEIKISVLVAEEYTELAVRALHSAYGLDAD